MSDKKFVHLHVHTEYSLLDGAARVDALFRRCGELGMPSVAMTDHGNMFAAVKFGTAPERLDGKAADEAKKIGAAAKKNGVKPIFGCEFYVDKNLKVKESAGGGMPRFHHLVLLAKDREGYSNLVKLNSVSYVDGFYYKPRIDYDVLEKRSGGLVCLTACLSGGVPQLLEAGDEAGARALALRLKSMFAPGDFYIELQDYGLERARAVLPRLVKLASEIGVKTVATNDVHYINRADSETQKVLMAIAFKRTVGDMAYGGDDGYFATDQFYLKTREEMEEMFGAMPEALDTTLEIADKCNAALEFKQPLFPGYTPPDGKNAFEFLRDMTYDGLKRKYREVTDEIKRRADYELEVIKNSGFLEYYLIVWDFIRYAESIGVPVGPGRGSGVGSLVAYAVGITKVDPLKYNLLFERFLNPERVSSPDFDIDFCFERREEVISYVIERYGASRVAQIITFGTLAAKAAIKDVGRVYGVPYSRTDELAKSIPFTAGHTSLSEFIQKIPELKEKYDGDPDLKKVLDMAMNIEGMPRQTSTHAAGIVICKDDIDKFVPLQRNGEDVTTQFDMIEVEKIGLLKMDFLGLRTLTDIKKALEYVKEGRGEDIDFYAMEYDDAAVYAMIGAGDTDAVFQLESSGMKNFMTRLKPSNVEDLIAGISLFRPGPMDSIDRYIANRADPSGIRYRHESLKSALGVTYGCIIYQEQVMQIVREMAGYSLARADNVRRLMSKKKAEEMKREREIFINGLAGADGKIIVEGAVRRGIPANVALAVFNEMESFAEYAFNKSHAAAYAFLAYQTAYLKRYYEAEYITAVLNNRISNIDEIKRYLNYLKERGIKVYPPDVNLSAPFFSVENGGVRIGLAALKGLGVKAIEAVIAERERGGRFEDLPDFVRRMGDVVYKTMAENLIHSGAFDAFGKPRSVLAAAYPSLASSAASDRRARARGQFSMFDNSAETGIGGAQIARYPNVPEYPADERLRLEREVLGVYISAHPLDAYREELAGATFNTSMAFDDADEAGGGVAVGAETAVTCVGLLTEVRRIVSKKTGREFAVARLEDLHGAIDVMFSGYKYDMYKSLLKNDAVARVRGKLSRRDGGQPSIRADFMEIAAKKTLAGDAAAGGNLPAAKLCVCYSFGERGETFKAELNELLGQFPGADDAYVRDKDTGALYAFGLKVRAAAPLLNELYALVEPSDIILKRA